MVKSKNWIAENYLYVELSTIINGVNTTYTNQFALGHDLQEAIDFCLTEFNNANGTNYNTTETA